MILIGTKGITKTTGEGHFLCPFCRLRRLYEHKRVRRFLTLYFVPLIPLDVVGEYVECSECHLAFEAVVLERELSTCP